MILFFLSISLFIFSELTDAGAIEYILLCYFILLSLIFFKGFKPRCVSPKLQPFIFVFSLLLIFNTTPLLENDFNRYFIEAYYYLKGIDIYHVAPSTYFTKAEKLSVYFENVGFPDIPSIYGFLTHLFHGFFVTLFSGKGILWSLQTFYFIGLSIFAYLNRSMSLFLIFYLFREFVNSVHIDALSSFFLFVGIYFGFKDKFKSSLIFLALALATKISVIIYIPFITVTFHNFKRASVQGFIVFLLIYSYHFLQLPAIEIFLNDWRWNSGIASLFSVWAGSFSIVVVFIGFALFCRFNLVLKRKLLFHFLGVLSLTHLLLSNTINGWYLVYPILFFCFSNRKIAYHWIILIWPLCYAPWGNNDQMVLISTFLFHVAGWCLVIYESLRVKQKLKDLLDYGLISN